MGPLVVIAIYVVLAALMHWITRRLQQEATAEAAAQPTWKKATRAIVLACAVLAFPLVGFLPAVLGSGLADDSGARAAVAAVLERDGFAVPHVRRQHLATHCAPNSFAYRWSAMGANGRACAQKDDGQIRVKVDRTWRS